MSRARTDVLAFDEGTVLRALRISLDDPRDILNALGALIRAESQRAFREQRLGSDVWPRRMSPNWPAIVRDFSEGRTPPERRFRPRPALIDTGRLRGSITWRLIGEDTVEVGSNLPYAGALHAGLPTESDVISEDVQKQLYEWMKSLGRAAKRSKGDEKKQGKAAAAKSLGWLLNPDLTGKRKTINHPPRPIVGVPDSLVSEVEEALNVTITKVAA